MLKKQKAVLW